MELDYVQMSARLLLAFLAGGVIGMERALHGREAGFRTHALVCVASSLLMILMVYQWELVPARFLETVRADPSRMAQGIMTGIGFLGAGVIIKEGLTVRGLTTAASIWITASIGIVIGMGLYYPAFLATGMTVVILSLFRWIESRLPSQMYAKFTVRFIRARHSVDEEALRKLIAQHHIRAFEASYKLDNEGKHFEYEMTIRSKNQKDFRRLAQSLVGMEEVYEFSIVPC
ncbi:MAG TPA: MgtC/SapB family protein [Gammaproteobacteria bacterium]|nr:MgtC/SapB family protein [Gammaproteobacteria bacterium]